MTRAIAGLLRWLADRIDYDGAPKRTHWSFTVRTTPAGMVADVNTDGTGCPLAYLGREYDRALAGPLG